MTQPGNRNTSATQAGGQQPARSAGRRGAGATEVRDGGGRKNRNWLWLLLLALVAVVVLVFVLSRCGGDDHHAAPAPPSSGAPSPSASAATPESAAAPASPSASAGQLSADGRNLFPLPQGGDLTSQVGKPVSARAVPVQSVPGPEGFWLGNSVTDRVWVKLLPQGNSPVAVRPGQLLDLDGTMVANPENFTADEHIDAADGADQLNRQKAHVEVSHSQPQVVGSR